MSESNQTRSDQELVEEIKNGNANSFKNLYYRYHDQLINFVFYRTGSYELSADMIQDVFSKIWIKRKKLNQKKSIKAYLYKSLNNQLIDHYKSAAYQNESLTNDKFRNLSTSSIEIDSQIDIKNAISKLPEKLHIVYTLSRYDGYSYKEIAQICQISIKTVEKRMSKSFTLLRKYFS